MLPRDSFKTCEDSLSRERIQLEGLVPTFISCSDIPKQKKTRESMGNPGGTDLCDMLALVDGEERREEITADRAAEGPRLSSAFLSAFRGSSSSERMFFGLC